MLAHERCHLRWRDNLLAWIHMWVEALFWFHPLVWWIGARLIEERERACDEQVVRDGHTPERYAEGILAVCEHYIASRLPCVSGVSGADLRKRIESILKNTLTLQLDRPRKLALAAIAGFTVAAPLTAGMLSGSAVQMLFSSAYSAATVDYFRLGIASDGQLNEARSSGSVPLACPLPGPEVIRRQNALTGIVARLSADDGEKVLLFAVAANSKDAVRRLLASGAARSGDGLILPNSLMYVAARYADASMLETLASAGFSIDERGSGGIAIEGSTPLMIAISSGRMENVDWLLRHGADPNATDKYGATPMVHALVSCGGQALVTRLIEAGAVPNEKARRIARNMRLDLGPPTALSVAAPPVVPPKSAAIKTAANPASPVSEEELRQHWLRPVPSELESQPWRAESSSRYVEATADFDGDGREDQASLFNATQGWQEGLFVKLSSQDPGKWQPVAQVFHPEGKAAPVLMGIRVASPGTYATACGKGYWTCGAGEPREVILTRPGIEYFRIESAASLVYWDETARRFRQVWSSD